MADACKGKQRDLIGELSAFLREHGKNKEIIILIFSFVLHFYS